MRGDAHSSLSSYSHPPHVVFASQPGSVAFERALLAGGVRPLENPILPGRQPAEDLGFHGLWPRKSKVRLHARHGVRREACAFLNEDADLILPVDLVEGKGDKAYAVSIASGKRNARLGFRRIEAFRLSQKAGLKRLRPLDIG